MTRLQMCKAYWRLFSDKLSSQSFIRFGFLSKSELIAIFEEKDNRKDIWLVFLNKIDGHNEETIKPYKKATEGQLSNAVEKSVEIIFLYWNEKDCLCLDNKGGSK